MKLLKTKGDWRQLHHKLEAQGLVIGLALTAVLSSQAIAQPGNNEGRHRGHGDNRASEQGQQGQQRGQDHRADQAANQAADQAARDARAASDAATRAATQAADQAARDTRAATDAANRAASRVADQAARDTRAANDAADQAARNTRAANYAADQAARNTRAANQAAAQTAARLADQAAEQAARDRRTANYAANRTTNRWDHNLDNRQRYQTYAKIQTDWNAQQAFLNANIARLHELQGMSQPQQSQLDSQMQAAYLSYHNNHWNGPNTWNNYSDPRFLNYLRTKQPSLVQGLLNALGLGGDSNYLYSSNWNTERAQLARNMANIHQLAVEGRITSSQERDLKRKLKVEFTAYHHNQWNGSYNWSQYSDPGFVDYLRDRRPSVLTTIRNYLVM